MNKFIALLKANMNDIIKPIAVLLSICIIIPLALALTNKLTAAKIEQLAKENQEKTMQLLIEADDFAEKKFGTEKKGFTYYLASKDSAPAGYVFITAAKGYGGDVSVMTAVGMDGKIKEIAILDAGNETPGLGKNVTTKGFLSQFSGKQAPITVVKNDAVSENNEINAYTGATISSTAVSNAVNEAMEQYAKVNVLSSSTTPTESEVAANE